MSTSAQRRPLPINGWTSPFTPTASQMLLVVPPADEFGRADSRHLYNMHASGRFMPPPVPPLLPPNPSVNAWTTRRGNTSCRYPRKGLAAYCRTSPMLAKGKGTRLRSQAVREPRLGVHQSFWPTSRTDAIGGSFGGKRTGGDWGCPARFCLRGINKRP